jgi:hypothetical protein
MYMMSERYICSFNDVLQRAFKLFHLEILRKRDKSSVVCEKCGVNFSMSYVDGSDVNQCTWSKIKDAERKL